MATYFSILAWRIPWTEEPGWLQSIGSQRVGHWVTNTFTFNGLSQTTLPKGVCSDHREIIWLCLLWKEEIDTSIPKASHSLRCFARLMALLLYFPTASPSLLCLFTLLPHPFSFWFYERTWNPDPWERWLFWDINLPSSRPAGFPNKVIFLASIPLLLDS